MFTRWEGGSGYVCFAVLGHNERTGEADFCKCRKALWAAVPLREILSSQ